MKQITKLMTRLRSSKPRRQGKRGSTMALVMMIISALVIWAMCLAPLMSTTGTTALKVQNSYTDYLSSRSAIEFAKSQLIYISRTGTPYTFAVVEVNPSHNNGEPYAAVNKRGESGNIESSSPLLPLKPLGDYGYYVNYDGDNDLLDKPWDSGVAGKGGNDVVAICTVVRGINNVFDIEITSYINGKAGLKLRIPYTHIGTLLIYPESYRQFQALPLSDYVLVDGMLGGNEVWTAGTKRVQTGNSIFGPTYSNVPYEAMLPWRMNPETTYASSGKYPAVFKLTTEAAEPPTDGFVADDPVVDEPFTDETWIRAFGAYDEENNGDQSKKGVVYLVRKDNGGYQVSLNNGSSRGLNITEHCKLYVNGTEVARSYQRGSSSSGYYYFSLPTNGSAYRVTVDYDGTGTTYNANSNNVIGAHGMVVSENSGTPSNFKTEISFKPTLAITKNSANTMTVTVNGVSAGGLYYCSSNKQWQTSNVFSGLDNDEVHYFYAYMPATVITDGNDKGKVTEERAVTYVGAVAGIGSAVSMDQMEAGKQYWIMDGNGNTLKNDSGLGRQTEFFTTDKSSHTTANGAYISSDNDIHSLKWNTFKWTVGKNDEKDEDLNLIYFENDPTKTNDNQYLDFSGTIKVSAYNQERYKRSTYWGDSWDNWRDNTEKPKSYTWDTFSISLSNNKNGAILNIKNNEISENLHETATVYEQTKEITETRTVGSGCSQREEITGYKYEYSGPITQNLTATRYLKFNNSNISTDSSGTKVYFVEVPGWASYNGEKITRPAAPAAPERKTPVNSYTAGSSWTKLYANGSDITTSGISSLKPGRYILTGYSDKQLLMPCEYIVEKGTLTSTLSVNYTQDANNDCKITFTGTSSSGDNGGVRYIGYKLVSETDYKWFPTKANGNDFSVTVCIPYGEYHIVFRESGSTSYSSREVRYENPQAADETRKYVAAIAAEYLVFEEDDFRAVNYSFVDGEIVWYKPLPDGVTPRRLHPVFSEDGSNWSETFVDGQTKFYGVYVDYSSHQDINHVLRLPQPLGLTNVNGRTSSMMRGSALYFMGDGNSINTYGNNIYLNCDLLVLKNGITGDGHIFVDRYSDDDEPILLYSVNSMTLGNVSLDANSFYLVDANSDLCTLTTEKCTWYGSINYGAMEGGDDTMEAVRNLVLFNGYPEPNMDIAFASAKQLSYIKNGEVFGWTDDGVLSGRSSTRNQKYVVCLYLTGINGTVERSANRVLVAAKDDALNISSDVTFTTRYLSVDTASILRSNGSSLTLKMLPMAEHPLKGIIGWFDPNAFQTHGATLQMDYEQNTVFYEAGGESPTQLRKVSRQICRYDSGTNLFTGEEQELMVTYPISTINGWFAKEGDAWYEDNLRYVGIVDRYMSIAGDLPTFTADSFWGSRLDIYSNYIYIDPAVQSIVDKGEGIMIHSQENGYEDDEYLFLFADESDVYSGTIIYIAPDTPGGGEGDGILVNNTFISSGFYYIFASEDGTSISALANALPLGTTIEEAMSQRKPFKVDPETLSAYSVYVLRDGSLSNAYANTFIENTGGTGGAFGVATVE